MDLLRRQSDLYVRIRRTSLAILKTMRAGEVEKIDAVRALIDERGALMVEAERIDRLIDPLVAAIADRQARALRRRNLQIKKRIERVNRKIETSLEQMLDNPSVSATSRSAPRKPTGLRQMNTRLLNKKT